jgi:hypothetical protein
MPKYYCGTLSHALPVIPSPGMQAPSARAGDMLAQPQIIASLELTHPLPLFSSHPFSRGALVDNIGCVTDYCDIFLTHDSPAVRKAHNTGWKHTMHVSSYYKGTAPLPFFSLLPATR